MGTNAQIGQRLRAGVGVSVKNFMIGAQDNFDYQRQVNSVGPFFRYYVPFGKFAVFPQMSVGFGSVTQTKYVLDWSTGQAIPKKSKQLVTEYLAGVGGSYFVAPNVALEAIVDIDIKKKRPSLDLGLQFYLRSVFK